MNAAAGTSPESDGVRRPGRPGRPRVRLAAGIRVLLILAPAALVLTQVYGAVRFSRLADPLPTHYGDGGTADAWSERTPLAAFLPLWIGLAVLIGLGVFTVLLDRIPQHYGGRTVTGAAHVGSTRALRWFLSGLGVGLSAVFIFACFETWSGSPVDHLGRVLVPLGVATALGLLWCIVAIGRVVREDADATG